MLSSKRNILQLVAVMREHGVRDVVTCPGSRNAPLVHTFSQVEDFRCHALTDERSAGFFAMGLALETGCPVAICVTSGSALLNVHPAVAEAFCQGVPLVVISADRPRAWIGQMDGQTMPQPGAFGQMVRMCVDLPEVHTDEDEWHVNRLVNEALLATSHHGKGPVHINVPISEPIYDFDQPILPQVRRIDRLEGLEADGSERWVQTLRAKRRCLLVLGQMSPNEQPSRELLEHLSQHVVIVGEHLSNCCDGMVVYGAIDDLFGRLNDLTKEPVSRERPCFAPELVITIGGHIISKQLKAYLRRFVDLEHWHVSEDGRVADLFRRQTLAIETKTSHFIEHMVHFLQAAEDAESRTFVDCWRTFVQQTSSSPCGSDATFSQKMVSLLMSRLPVGAVLHLANSSAVRYAQHYPLHGSISVYCNRGINGIEGCMSTAVGVATANPHRPNFLVIGDLSFFYDQNALWNVQLPQNLHIMLLNSGGGRIFDSLPVPPDPKTRNMVCANHHTTARSACQQYGVTYLSLRPGEDVQYSMDQFMANNQAVLLELFD